MEDWKNKNKLRGIIEDYCSRFNTNTVPNDKFFMIEHMVRLYFELYEEVCELRERIKWNPLPPKE